MKYIEGEKVSVGEIAKVSDRVRASVDTREPKDKGCQCQDQICFCVSVSVCVCSCVREIFIYTTTKHPLLLLPIRVCSVLWGSC